MKKSAYSGAIICVAAIAFSAGWLVGKGQRVRNESGGDGIVFVEGRASAFPAEYRAAATFVGKGKISEAERLYRQLTQKDPTSPDPYVGLAGCQMKRGDYQAARSLYRKALEKEPKSVMALIGLGSSHAFQSDYTNAAINYERAVALDEASADAHYGLAMAYAYLGETERARGHLDRLKQLNPGSRRIADLEELVERALPQPDAAPNAAAPDR